jgi:hypothetical protein
MESTKAKVRFTFPYTLPSPSLIRLPLSSLLSPQMDM